MISDNLSMFKTKMSLVATPNDKANIILSQQNAANEVLAKLGIKSIVAGGAARDWYYGKPANDIDVYYKSDLDREGILQHLEDIGVTSNSSTVSVREHAEFSSNYTKMASMTRVINFDYHTWQFQLMQVPNDFTGVANVIDDFPLSISKIVYCDSETSPSSEFSCCDRLGIILISNKGYNKHHPYVQKICRRFPEYKVYEQVRV